MTLSILSTLLVYTAWVALDRLTFSRLYPGIEPSFILRMESKFLVKWSLSGQGSLRKLPSWSPHPQLWGLCVPSSCPAGCESLLPQAHRFSILRWEAAHSHLLSYPEASRTLWLLSVLQARCRTGGGVLSCPARFYRLCAWLSKTGRMREWRSASLRQARQRLPPELPVPGREGALSHGQRQGCWIRLSFCLPVKPDLLLPGS